MKKLLSTYRRMPFWHKFGVWAGLASILSLLLAVAPFHAQSGDQQTTHGSQSPIISDNAGSINVHYNHASPSAQKSPVLRNLTYGPVLVVNEPRFVAGRDPNNQTCLALGGTPIRLLPETAPQAGIKMMWQRVQITGGPCAGKVGWATTENISYE
jgi:hypothetical protein